MKVERILANCELECPENKSAGVSYRNHDKRDAFEAVRHTDASSELN